jgi:N-carbamoyl-L-amino-acid hydrolase
MAVRAEESVWFQVSYIGSRSALGLLPEHAFQARRFDTGRTLAEHMRDSGGDPELVRHGHRSLEPNGIRAFIEVHIEQAPRLVVAGKPVGICTGIPGNFRYPDARVIGRYDHVGTPRGFRRDAAIAAGEFAVTLDALWAEREASGVSMAVTFGRFHTDAAAHGLTTVPGEFHFSLDARAYDAVVLAGFESRMREVIVEIEHRRRVQFVLGARASAPVGEMSARIVSELDRGAAELGIPTVAMGSPASHDAAAFASARVPVGMIFVRNDKGSHNPDESMSIDDFLDGTCLLVWWLIHQSVPRQ